MLAQGDVVTQGDVVAHEVVDKEDVVTYWQRTELLWPISNPASPTMIPGRCRIIM